MINLQQAINLATKAHKGQWRKPTIAKPHYILESGDEIYKQEMVLFIRKPYITHPLAVMDMMSTEEEKIIAVLHDVLKDTDITTAYLKHQGVPSHLINNLEWLTPIKGEPYEDYIKNISNYSLVTKVKIADITCNLLDNPSEHTKQKYLKAIPILLQNI